MKQKFLFIAFISCFIASAIQAQIKVSPTNQYLTTRDGKPFFWLGDTDWEIFHRLTREEAEQVLETRKQQGFNVIQAVALAEFNGVREPNRYGDTPLLNDDPTKLAITPGTNPNNPDQYDYWDNVDFVIKKAAEKGMYIGLLPTWGDKVTPKWGDGPVIFNPENAETYGSILANRYKNQWNIIWILGGDRPAKYKSDREGQMKEYDQVPIWRAMARGIESVMGKDVFITYHPGGGPNSTSQQIHQEDWLDMNSFQSGHGNREAEAWDYVTRDLALTPKKPTLDMEPCYEEHPVNPWDGKWTRQSRGYFTAYDVRARIYRGVFAGACGVTYGHHSIWQFVNPKLYKTINLGDTLVTWQQALKAPAAGQMQFLKNLMLSRPYLTRVADQSLIVSDKGSTYVDVITATRDEQSAYAFIYLPQNKPVTVDVAKITGKTKNIWWYNPSTGKATAEKTIQANDKQTFTPPSEGKDWVLVIDDASKKFKMPGKL
ncbi:glycoside hydrolase family 140 protein [Adhaeribacter swui]|uniref:Glycoside hydrolase family 140 protein n=1 Tax=Adhaeribacter swui TaxID=2086471 RepID=A0A7G7G6M2_9BACT|nr:glycoside hydrolase family 140 protein [Adhaeribacter swui]QNF32806.1 glycoside hydrolase family 140 protein [Adhaeribacter swui]